MKFLTGLLLVLLASTPAFAQDITNFCKSIPQSNFSDILMVADNREAIQVALHQRDNRVQIEGLLLTYNELSAKLGNVTSDSFNPIMAIAGFCYGGLPESIAEGYIKTACPDIRPTKVRDLVNLALTAKAIISFSSGPETPEIKLLTESKLTAEFIDSIETLFSICGASLGLDDPIEEEPIEEEVEEDPGVCLASPYSDLSRFLWKPVSDSNGRLVVLTNPTTSLVVNGETLTDVGPSNGRCTTSRGAQSGCSYGEDVLIAVTSLAEFRIIKIPNGCERYDCNSSLSACGLESWDTEELIKLKKQKTKLVNRVLVLTNAKQKRKLKIKIKEINRILKYARSFQE